MAVPNPFATRFTRPGRLGPLDGDGRPVDLDALLDRLDRLGGAAAIVGPHGSGKSTLLVHLHEAGVRRGLSATMQRLGPAWAGMATALAVGRAPRHAVFLLDGWETLGPVARWAIRAARQASGCRVLVTCHHHTGLPTLVCCSPTPAVLGALVRQLPDAPLWLGPVIDEADLRDAFAQHGGNLREALFALYDRFETRRAPAHMARS